VLQWARSHLFNAVLGTDIVTGRKHRTCTAENDNTHIVVFFGHRERLVELNQ
jgi:hypothetical protein